MVVYFFEFNICNQIYIIRGQQVMLDYDLAGIYGYEVKRLNEQVKRNIARFPEDFMFQLTKGELAEQQSIFIMRAFREMRHYIKQNQQFVTQAEMHLVSARVSEISVKTSNMADRQKKTEQNIQIIQKSIDTLNENFVSDRNF